MRPHRSISQLAPMERIWVSELPALPFTAASGSRPLPSMATSACACRTRASASRRSPLCAMASPTSRCSSASAKVASQPSAGLPATAWLTQAGLPSSTGTASRIRSAPSGGACRAQPQSMATAIDSAAGTLLLAYDDTGIPLVKFEYQVVELGADAQEDHPDDMEHLQVFGIDRAGADGTHREHLLP
ncbi:hypothetical protein CBM2634_U40010 [Cupriavidus taiwanensis]|uniref:Uncharacterized protein n=1 Tax=Cupriavidus taiwanensis TaxID=164546 RepID=A0A375JCF7_9BURK|nr:hypothetical protein CBM2634_U40010 [Cupriavidus taiwanensis]